MLGIGRPSPRVQVWFTDARNRVSSTPDWTFMGYTALPEQRRRTAAWTARRLLPYVMSPFAGPGRGTTLWTLSLHCLSDWSMVTSRF